MVTPTPLVWHPSHLGLSIFYGSQYIYLFLFLANISHRSPLEVANSNNCIEIEQLRSVMKPQMQEQGHWLDKYATNYAEWKLSDSTDGRQLFNRPLGLVETSFDSDGTYYGGRAGMQHLSVFSYWSNISLKISLVLRGYTLYVQEREIL